ncbi:hypothetical protein [Streptomyces aurantiogriseus]|uniref:Uncharacterized protein n=1 Tax=Streptomyces aurantiogriseus TaxID=66870 RepID=A0A918FP41_9ACTN|nr:hypothetical protein [Streptomyces aurantiogriseus]GGR61224.1 hypothetical protein GCM10010251_92460 [Streptomyces aurantiogriseus]
MTRTRTYAHGCTTATIGLLLAAGYSATFNPWLILPGGAGAAATACLAAQLYTADRRERAIADRLQRLRNAEPLRPTDLDRRERQALALIAHHLRQDTA